MKVLKRLQTRLNFSCDYAGEPSDLERKKTALANSKNAQHKTFNYPGYIQTMILTMPDKDFEDCATRENVYMHNEISVKKDKSNLKR